MIVSAPITVGDVVTLKIISSEEVIGRLEAFKETSITIKKPMTFMMGAQGLGLVPYAFSAPSDVSVDIPLSLIVCKIKTDEMVAKQYIHQTTGLAL